MGFDSSRIFTTILGFSVRAEASSLSTPVMLVSHHQTHTRSPFPRWYKVVHSPHLPLAPSPLAPGRPLSSVSAMLFQER